MKIRLRAWDPENKIMHYNVQLWSDFRELLLQQGKYENWVVMEWTKLHDRNGVNIYEGDILQVTAFGFEYICKKCGYMYTKDGYYEVIWFPSESRSIPPCWHISAVCNLNGERIFGAYPLTELVAFHSQVVGNIYQNPELLEEKE